VKDALFSGQHDDTVGSGEQFEHVALRRVGRHRVAFLLPDLPEQLGAGLAIRVGPLTPIHVSNIVEFNQ
jgi:hypothetical protein